MAGRISAERRKQEVEKIYSLFLAGHTNTSIAEQTKHGRPFVTKVIREETERRYDERDAGYEDQQAIEHYREVIREAWDRLKTINDPRSLNVSGLLNTIIRAQERIDKITGIESPIKTQDVGDINVTWPDLEDIENLKPSDFERHG
jgi:hypothetical protein